MPEERWARRCRACGWVDPGARHATKELSELKAYSGYQGQFEHQGPRCRECGSLDIEGVPESSLSSSDRR